MNLKRQTILRDLKKIYKILLRIPVKLLFSPPARW
jgi:hypothetical protein